MKHCSRCGNAKLLSEFYKSSRSKDGYAPWCKVCMHSYQRETRLPRNPQEQKRAHLRRTFGITQAEYEAMLIAQNGVCAACGRPETKTDPRNGELMDLAIDHCHTTGKIRALLCGGCNTALGLLQDSPERIEQLLRYIQKFQVVQITEEV